MTERQKIKFSSRTIQPSR